MGTAVSPPHHGASMAVSRPVSFYLTHLCSSLVWGGPVILPPSCLELWKTLIRIPNCSHPLNKPARGLLKARCQPWLGDVSMETFCVAPSCTRTCFGEHCPPHSFLERGCLGQGPSSCLVPQDLPLSPRVVASTGTFKRATEKIFLAFFPPRALLFWCSVTSLTVPWPISAVHSCPTRLSCNLSLSHCSFSHAYQGTSQTI